MKQNQNIWVKEAFIGHELLHSNNKLFNSSIVFTGAEKKNSLKNTRFISY